MKKFIQAMRFYKYEYEEGCCLFWNNKNNTYTIYGSKEIDARNFKHPIFELIISTPI